MALSQAEISARFREKKKQQNCMRINLWADSELSALLKTAIADKNHLSKEKALHAVLLESLQAIICNNDSIADNIADNKSIIADNIARNEEKQTENNQLKEKNENLQGRIYELEKIIDGHLRIIADNIADNDKNSNLEKENNALSKKIKDLELLIARNDDSIADNIASNEKSVDSNLIFDLEKAKVIAIELKSKGLTGNEIANELTRQGYGNKRGKPFSKSSVNKWNLSNDTK